MANILIRGRHLIATFHRTKDATLMANTTADTTEPSTEVEVRTSSTDVAAAIQGLNNGGAFYSSISGDDFAAKLALASALTTSENISDNLGKTINLVNIVIQPVELVNDTTGEVETAPRVVLIDQDGTAYSGTSIGLLTSVRNTLAALGQPASWPQPVPVQVIEKKGNGKYKFFSLQFV